MNESEKLGVKIMTEFALHLTALYAGILTLMQVAFSINVVRNRARSEIM